MIRTVARKEKRGYIRLEAKIGKKFILDGKFRNPNLYSGEGERNNNDFFFGYNLQIFLILQLFLFFQSSCLRLSFLFTYESSCLISGVGSKPYSGYMMLAPHVAQNLEMS